VKQVTLNASIHYPGCDPTLVPSNSACEVEGITRTGGRSCSELSSNATCIEIQSPRFAALFIATSMTILFNVTCKIGNALSSLNSLVGIMETT